MASDEYPIRSPMGSTRYPMWPHGASWGGISAPWGSMEPPIEPDKQPMGFHWLS